MTTRILFVDDSGKPDEKHASHAVVIAGFSIPADVVPTLSRRILGAKTKFFPGRGRPTGWEIKAAAYIKPNPWKRSKNREFVHEVVRIIGSLGGTIYSVSLDKARMKHAMTLAQTTPLQLQALVEHFEVECRHRKETGMIIADWSSHHADQHASNCVASFVASRRLNLHPSVYYASSHGTEAIQVADLAAGVCRRVAEGDPNLAGIARQMDGTCSLPSGHNGRSFKNRSFQNRIQLF